MADLVAVLVGAAVAGGFTLAGHREAARRGAKNERRIDVRTSIDLGVEALADAEFHISVAEVRARAYIAGHPGEAYIEMDAHVNQSVRDMRVAGRRIDIREPASTGLADAFRRAETALLDLRAAIQRSAEDRHINPDVVSARAAVEDAVARYDGEAAKLLK